MKKNIKHTLTLLALLSFGTHLFCMHNKTHKPIEPMYFTPKPIKRANIKPKEENTYKVTTPLSKKDKACNFKKLFKTSFLSFIKFVQNPLDNFDKEK